MNWGKGITVGIVLFMLFIISFVIRAFQFDFDLVREDYYEQESNFEDERQSKQNYMDLNAEIEILQEEKGICLQFPESVNSKSEGKIYFYRPNDKKMDRRFELKLNEDHQQWLEYENFFEGYYDVFISWSDQERSYIFEDDIQF